MFEASINEWQATDRVSNAILEILYIYTLQMTTNNTKALIFPLPIY